MGCIMVLAFSGSIFQSRRSYGSDFIIRTLGLDGNGVQLICREHLLANGIKSFHTRLAQIARSVRWSFDRRTKPIEEKRSVPGNKLIFIPEEEQESVLREIRRARCPSPILPPLSSFFRLTARRPTPSSEPSSMVMTTAPATTRGERSSGW